MRNLSAKLILPVALAALVVAALPAPAQVEGVRFSLEPGADYYLWDDNMGLKDSPLYGGRLSADLGRFVALQGYYVVNDRVKTDLAKDTFEDWPEPSVVDQKLRVQNYGADLVFNLGRGPVVPFIKGGGGIVRLDPEDGEVFEQIVTRAGFGTRFDLYPRVCALIQIEDVMVRFDRTRLLPPEELPKPPPVDPKSNSIRHNLTFGAGLSFQLSGAPAGETNLDRAIQSRYSGGLFGASWPIEPYAGRLNYDKAAGLADQSLLGVRTGVNLGDLLGLRAYYWHGMNDSFDDTDPVQSWGGEAQFNLAAGQGVIPYLLLGVGHLDFLKDFRDDQGSERCDQGLLILGGGVGLTLSRSFRIDLAARDNIFSESDLSDLAQPSELLHNWAFSGGLSFILGGGRPQAGAAPAAAVTPGSAVAASSPGSAVIPYAPSGQVQPGASPPAPPPPPQAPQLVLGTDGRIVWASPPPAFPQSFQGERTVTLPVPTVGELYVRYGEPGGVSIVSGSGEVTPSPAATDEERLAVLERRLEERLSAWLDQRLAEERLSAPVEAPREAPSQTIVIPPAAPSLPASPVEGRSTIGVAKGGNILYPYLGVNLDYPEQFLVASRLDVGPIRPGSRIRLLPELALGFFNKGSFMFCVNTQYNFGKLERKGQLSPYAFAGLGVIRFGKGVDRDRTGAVFNLGYGLARNFGGWTAFVEHQGIDFFSLQRLNMGLRWPL